MKRTLLISAACVAMLAAAPVAGATPGNGNGHENGNHGASAAAKLCAAEKKADFAAFKAVWGKHAMRDCIRANRGTSTSPAAGAEAFHNAAEQCRTERDADPAGFQTTYGGNRNGRNAFGKCVSQHANGTYQEGTPVA
jgi:hypothetical protein